MSILFTDLDGTLLNDSRAVSDYSRKVIEEMVRTGHKLVLSSGRPLNSVLAVKEAAGLNFPNMYVIAFNGCSIYDCDAGRNVQTCRVPRDIVEDVWKLADDMQIHIQTYSEDSIIVKSMDREIEYYTRAIRIPVIVNRTPLDILPEGPYKMLSISLDDRAHHEEFQAEVLRRHGDRLDAFFSNNNYLEMFSRNAGKGTAVNWLCDYLGIPMSDCYAAGDEMNDYSMLEAAGHGVAMKNANPDLLPVAEYVTEYTNDEDGLARFIEKHIL